ncbi:MAG TPA: glycosyltransferase family 2 protein [Paracoccaceae bacterium]|nr:glycosyltransferase family 2 protein [Paracoccaceae bacterium]
MSQPSRPSVSLVIVSRGRPALLARCLTAVAQMDHPSFEVIVVADPAGLNAIADRPVKAIAFDEANISQARNLGIAAAAGEVVAFIDDDAVPEPLWLWHLSQPFAEADVLVAGGFVLGRNGISFEWRGGMINGALEDLPLDEVGGDLSLYANHPGRAVEVKGVNCAYRRDVLLSAGGFDPNLHYYLDETELNLRLAALGGLTAVVSDARVHHTKAESAQRSADRVPKTLYDIGFSTAVTLMRHAPSDQIAAAYTRLRQVEAAKVERFVRAKRLSRQKAQALLQGYDQGIAAGRALRPAPPVALASETLPFRPFPGGPRPLVTLSGRPWRMRSLQRKAGELVRSGHIVRLYVFSPTALFHRRRFADGVWVQQGGLFGKSNRSDPLVRFWGFGRRLSRESALFLSGFRKT